MKIIYNSIIPFPGYAYMNLFGILFGRTDQKMKLTKRDINHESIHTEQYKDLGYIMFLPLYLLEWIIKLPFGLFYNKKQKVEVSTFYLIIYLLNIFQKLIVPSMFVFQ